MPCNAFKRIAERAQTRAFDQPGVEQSKIASYAVLGNKEEKYVNAAEEMSKQTLPFAEYVM